MKMLISSLLAGALVSVSILGSSLPVSAANSKFRDVPSTYWANQSIYTAVEKGYFKGYSDGTFRPKANITRAEFAALIARVADYEGVQSSADFSDMKGHWAESAVNTAVGMGFIKAADYPNGFQPGKALTREEMAKWLSSGLAANDTEYKQAWTDTKTTVLPVKEYFQGQISQTKAPFIAIVMGTGLMKGYTDGTFGLTKTTTRAEVSAIVLRLENVLSKSANSFADLTELRAVGTEKSNLELVTPFTTGNNGFADISDKKFTFKNGSGSLVFHRAIAVNTQDWNNKKSIYSDVFVSDTDRKFLTSVDELYPIFIQITIYPEADGFSLDHYFNGRGNLLTGSRIVNTNPTKFGYQTLPYLEPVEFFKKYKKGVTIWVQKNLTPETLFSTNMDDGSFVQLQKK
ncbi:S-layer homology domain-containing protein [Paenibacillus provencensis]|uniref:S-layer homology domain-containing protein n=1 Tax=Paenibacillus provencensis TaxID=441151 RepID=A0ABW3PSH7_9BACL|nr:S-layer homology domain-containing protein [Paenibacillus sp. MER 78]MCM3126697.1 S-layer homology domain-containing protein [Paenibacillus sp. MER 78]